MPRARQEKFSRTVKLPSGGTLTLSGTADPLSLTAGDRQFVFEIVDLFARYSANVAAAEKSDGGPATGSAG